MRWKAKHASTLSLVAFLFWASLNAQSVIGLENPSLEGKPAPAKVPSGWYFCGDKKGNIPDLHPDQIFQVTTLPRKGRSYTGLVARPNGNTGAIGQRLGEPLVPGQCYELSFFAARASDYIASLSTTRESINFNQPLTLRLLAGNEACRAEQILDETQLVRYPDWSLFTFQFRAKQAFRHIWIQVGYQSGKGYYPGNILIDDLSALFPIDCESHAYLFVPDTLHPAPIQSQEAWSAYIQDKVECLEFDQESESLARHPYYWQDSQKLLYGNVALHSLAIALKYFPERVLEIRLKGNSRRVRKGRKRELKRAWKAFGQDLRQIQVRTTRRSAFSPQSWVDTPWLRARLQ